MKRSFALIPITVLCVCLLTGCFCRHDWAEATCTAPKTCALCEEVEGEALGHSWMEATCEAPKTCAACGETEGEAPGHQWQDADCVNAKTYTVCQDTEGDALGHVYGMWACTGEEFGHSCEVCAHQEALSPEMYAQMLLTGSWTATFMLDGTNMVEHPGHTATFYEDGTGTLVLNPRLDYPGEFLLCFEEFAFQDGLQCWSVDFYLDEYLAEDWEKLPPEYGVTIRLLIPNGSRGYTEPFMTMQHLGYWIVWEFEKDK